MLNELPNTYPFSPGTSRPQQPSHSGRNPKSKWGSAGKDGAKRKTKSRPKNSDSSDKPGETPEINRPVTSGHHDTGDNVARYNDRHMAKPSVTTGSKNIQKP